MKKITLLTILAMLVFQSIAQDSGDKPVRNPWETTVLMDYATTKNTNKGAFELMINHRFGTFANGISDLYGIYAPSNIRMAFNYGVTKKLMIGFGTEKNNKMQDFQLKYSILTQTRNNKIPVSLSFYGAAVIDARESSYFGKNYAFQHRLSYFSELILAKKINYNLSLLTSVSFTHFNAVNDNESHDKLGWRLGGKYTIWNSNSFIFEYTQPFNSVLKRTNATLEAKPGLSAGMEFGTSTHCFQVFVSNYNNLLRQKNMVYNTNDFFGGDVLVGFNITVRF